jgi:hypothetical protein
MTWKALAVPIIGFCGGVTAAQAETAMMQARSVAFDAPIAAPDKYTVEFENEQSCLRGHSAFSRASCRPSVSIVSQRTPILLGDVEPR